jgi:hypothetical protein
MGPDEQGHLKNKIREIHPRILYKINGAGDGVRTRDPKLGKLVLYQLSYARLM